MMDEYRQTLEQAKNLQRTENGAIGYSTTGNVLVDLNFTVPSNHNNVSLEDIHKFWASLEGDLVTTVKWLFYLRDVREGLGERDSFVNLYITLYNYDQDDAIKVLPLIPEYGRWKDVIDLLERSKDDTPLADAIYYLISKQLKEDVINLSEGKSVSLLAKWMPSINASKKSRRIAIRLEKHLGFISMGYRKVLSALRKYIDVTEVKTCGGDWDKVDYNKVSSNANSRYLNAFMKHDPERRKKYLEELAKPTPVGAVMHASNLYPHEVYAKYNINGRPRNIKGTWRSDEPAVADPGIEALWNNLKNIPSTGNTMVVCDGSGSMESRINGSSVMAIDVARALGVFFAERCEGEFHNKLIEFSSYPEFIDLTKCESLADKYNVMCMHDDCSNTNLEKVFDLLLKTTVEHKLPQDELPQRILIVSDMEFDKAGEFTTAYDGSGYDRVMEQYRTLFDTIKMRWASKGYTMPEMVFWNVNSRTKTIPVTSNEVGVKLVSGFSVNNVKLILSGEIDPWTSLKSVLDSERYLAVEDALKNA